jgi:outer membrane protein assembly factor BamB
MAAAALIHFSRRRPDRIADSPAPISHAFRDKSADSDWIAFHDGGPLLGVASALRAPPMKLRWKFRIDDDDEPSPMPATRVAASPLTRPAAAPTTGPATVPSAVASIGPAYHQAGHFEGAAAIVDGVVYVADTAGAVRAIDAVTGKRIWIYQSDDGFETSPLVLDGRVLLGDLGGLFHAISAQTGKKIWTFDSGSPIHSSANFFGKDRARIVFGNDGADIFCLNADTGKQVWTQKAGDRINGCPAVANGTALISGCDSQLRALKEKDGAEEYSFDLGALCPGSAAVAGDRMVMGADQGRVLCISAKTHQQLWLFTAPAQEMVYSSPAIADGIVVFGARDRLVYGLDLTTGKQLWSYPTRGEVDSSPLISSGRVYIASKDKKLYVLDLKTGRELWSFTAGRGITATPAIGDGALVIGDSGGNLFCLE